MIYKDNEGKKLYGFSQVSLEQNTYWTKALALFVALLTIALILVLLFLIWIVRYIIVNNVLNNAIAEVVRGLLG